MEQSFLHYAYAYNLKYNSKTTTHTQIIKRQQQQQQNKCSNSLNANRREYCRKGAEGGVVHRKII